MKTREEIAAILAAARDSGILLLTEQARGAYPNFTRVRKTRHRPGDAHAAGALATVIGSAGPVPDAGGFGYMVLWDEPPGADAPCFVAGNVLEAVDLQ